MKNDKDMEIKIQNASLGGEKNISSCRNLAEYLEHEDDERKAEGKDVIPFMTPGGVPVSKEEVIDKIDRNHSHLGKEDYKFYSLIVAPSEDEIRAMGATEQEQRRAGIKLAKAISDAYAENYHRDEIHTADDLVIFWKIHFSRGDNKELQFHLHGVVSRNSKASGGRAVKMSPMTNHKNTTDGPVKGGFDRKEFYKKGEQIFDELFDYDRKVAETFDYKNTQKHGTTEEKVEQANKLAEEKMLEDTASITEALRRRKQNNKSRADIEALAESLLRGKDIPDALEEINPVEKAINDADLGIKLIRIFRETPSLDNLTLSLMMIGVSIVPVMGQLGGVEDLIVISNGRKINASDIVEAQDHNGMVHVWSQLNGQTPELVLRAQLQKEQSRKAAQVEPPKKKIGRNI